MPYTVGFVGTGPDPEDPNTEGFAMAYRHASGYERLDDCRIVACADIVRENAAAFADAHGLGTDHVYEDYERMLRAERPDVVSVCVPPGAHADVVVGCAETGVPAAIHCEKPMATTWEDCRRMTRVCEDRGVQLTFNHQRRFAEPFRRAKELLDEGTVGPLRRVEIGGPNLYDYGSHLFDLCGLYTDQVDPEWVLAEIDYRTENRQFGAHNENQALAQWRYENGVYGLASTGDDRMVSQQVRLVGRDGVIEVGTEDGPTLRYTTDSGGWTTEETGDSIHGPRTGLFAAAAQRAASVLPGVSPDRFRPATFVERAIEEVVTALDEGRESELSAANALQSTELIFASWESARRRGRVDLPLDVGTNALEELYETGAVPAGRL